MSVIEQRRIAEKALDIGIATLANEAGPILDICGRGMGVEQLRGDMLEHAAYPRNDFVAEQRMVVAREQMAQDRPKGADQGVTLGQIVAQDIFDIMVARLGHAGPQLSLCPSLSWLSQR